MSQVQLSEAHSLHQDAFSIPDEPQWIAAVEATVFALALLKQKLDTGECAADLDSHAHREFCRALGELEKIPTSTDDWQG